MCGCIAFVYFYFSYSIYFFILFIYLFYFLFYFLGFSKPKKYVNVFLLLFCFFSCVVLAPAARKALPASENQQRENREESVSWDQWGT